MSNTAMNRELEELRAQVAELTRTRKAETLERHTVASGSSAQTAVDAQGSTSTDVLKSDDDESGFSSQMQELVDALEQELKGSNPMTMLIVFALGILLGRLLPR